MLKGGPRGRRRSICSAAADTGRRYSGTRRREGCSLSLASDARTRKAGRGYRNGG